MLPRESKAVTHQNVEDIVSDAIKRDDRVQKRLDKYRQNPSQVTWTLLLVPVRTSFNERGYDTHGTFARQMIENTLKEQCGLNTAT